MKRPGLGDLTGRGAACGFTPDFAETTAWNGKSRPCCKYAQDRLEAATPLAIPLHLSSSAMSRPVHAAAVPRHGRKNLLRVRRMQVPRPGDLERVALT